MDKPVTTKRDMARHALGLPNEKNTAYRNYYETSEDGPDRQEWLNIVDSGLAIQSGESMFHLSLEGVMWALEQNEAIRKEDFVTTEPGPIELKLRIKELEEKNAKLKRKVDPNEYYPTKCMDCGWSGSSKFVRVHHYDDDCDTACPCCHSFNLEDGDQEINDARSIENLIVGRDIRDDKLEANIQELEARLKAYEEGIPIEEHHKDGSEFWVGEKGNPWGSYFWCTLSNHWGETGWQEECCRGEGYLSQHPAKPTHVFCPLPPINKEGG